MPGTPSDVVEMVIERVGSGGDGVAHLGPTPVFVPFALPGERVRARLQERRGDGYGRQVLDRLENGASRAEPPCPHFGRCDGCQLQHLTDDAYAEWVRGQVIEALRHRGLTDVEVAAPVISPPGTRRRVRLAFARRGGDGRLGFRERAGRRIVDVAVCPIAAPPIGQLLPGLRALLRHLPLAARRGDVKVTAADTGLDVLLITPDAPQLADREALADFAERHDVARVSWRAAAGAFPDRCSPAGRCRCASPTFRWTCRRMRSCRRPGTPRTPYARPSRRGSGRREGLPICSRAVAPSPCRLPPPAES